MLFLLLALPLAAQGPGPVPTNPRLSADGQVVIDGAGNFLQRHAYDAMARSLLACADLDSHLRDLPAATAALSDSVAHGGGSAAAWTRLGCLRWLGAWPETGISVGKDAVNTLRIAKVHGYAAIDAWVHAVAISPGDSVASTLLANSIVTAARNGDLEYGADYVQPWLHSAASDAAVATLEASTRTTNAPASVFRSCASINIVRDNFAAARDCSLRALAAGKDSTWHALRLAWIAYRAGDSLDGQRWFDRALTSAHDESARADLGWHFQVARTVDRLAIDSAPRARAMAVAISEDRQWLTLPDQGLLAWIHQRTSTCCGRGRWVAIDADLSGHFLRLTYDNQMFRGCTVRDSVAPCRRDAAAAVPQVVATRYQFWGTGDVAMCVLPVTVRRAVASDSTVTLPDSLRLRQWSASEAAVQDTVLHVTRNADGRSGYLETPCNAALAEWSVRPRTEDSTRLTGSWQDAALRVARGSLALSDLMVSDSADRTLAIAGINVPAVAMPAFDHHTPIVVRYQTKNDGSTVDASVAIRVCPTQQPEVTAGCQMSVRTPARLAHGITWTTRTMDIGRLPAGEYWLHVVLISQGRTAAVATAELRVR
jgi:hypothetical protein